MVWLLSLGKTRTSIGSVVKAFFCKQFVYVYVIALIYIGLSIALLQILKIWDKSLIKDTVMWILFVGWPLMFQAAKIDSFQKFLKDMVKPLIAFSIIFEYIFGLYTFPLWIELLMIPALVMIGGMLAFSEKKSEHVQVQKLLNGTLSISGLVALLFVVIHLISHFKEYKNVQVLMQFLMPLCLSILFLPLLYGLAMYINYETAFVSLKRHFRHHTSYRYAILMTMLRFNGDLPGMIRWRQMVQSKNLQSKAEINDAIALIKTLQKSEQNPHTVAEGLGWSPYQVKDVLVSKGINTPEYSNTVDEEFSSISFPFKINGNSASADTITFMVLGEQLIATELHLGLKVYRGSENTSISHLDLLNCSEILYEGVFGSALPKEIKAAILKGHNHTLVISQAILSVKKDLWHNKNMGYGINFLITHNNHRIYDA